MSPRRGRYVRKPKKPVPIPSRYVCRDRHVTYEVSVRKFVRCQTSRCVRRAYRKSS